MTADTYAPFPDLARIAFKNSDTSDHSGGGHCAGLLGETLEEHWDLVLSQHLVAFDHLSEKAEVEDGWALTRPVLFAAHHVCEVALKTEWVKRTGKRPMRGHYLEPHWTRLTKDGGLRHLAVEQFNETRAFIDVMQSLTPDGQTTRYPLPSEEDLGATWCCLNVGALRAAVYAFLERVEAPSA